MQGQNEADCGGRQDYTPVKGKGERGIPFSVLYGDTAMRYNTGINILKQPSVYKGKKNKGILCHQSTFIRADVIKQRN
ncbi:MAG: hypothetical protein LBF80_04795, partial [Spirochaetaceae bacterium]|nr:hypothetical protein [Spirochaetaceae bacterium]